MSPMEAVQGDRYCVLGRLGAGLGAYCAENSVDLDRFLTVVDLLREDFEPVDAYVSLRRFAILLEQLALHSGDDCFALHYAQGLPRGVTGHFGFGMVSAPTLRAAVTFSMRYLPLVVDTANLGSTDDGTDFVLSWSYSPLVVEREQCSDIFTLSYLSRLYTIAGTDDIVREVHLERRPPDNEREHRQVFRTNVVFNQPMNAFVLDSRALDLVSQSADVELHRHSTAECERRIGLRTVETSFDIRVQEVLLEGLQDGLMDIVTAARRLALSPRSLQRRLNESGTNFSDVLEGVRREAAMRYIRDTDRSFSEVAYLLGFSAPSAFTRAATRWFGAAPSALRKARDT
ncbi:MAG: AraC family transcriptional regulator ligand-binding domain-containing protein [Pseudomonadota bacterium]